MNITDNSLFILQEAISGNGTIYYPPEVSSMKYCHLGELRKEYFRLVTK